MRMHMRSYSTNEWLSKKVENHANAVALRYMFYNFPDPYDAAGYPCPCSRA